MTSVTGLTKERMLAIEAASVVGGSVDGSGHLILTKHDASTVDAGLVLGPGASLGPTIPANPRVGQIWYDTNNLTGLTDLMAASNPATSTASWLAYGYGYDTGVTFAVAGGGVTCSWTTTGNHFAGIPIAVTQGEQYLIKARVRVPIGSPDVRLTIGYKTSGQLCTIKGVDVTLILAYTADANSMSFGIESGGATGSCIVKELSVYQVNQKGYPEFFWDGTSWVQTEHSAQKADIYSRVNTYGDQTISGQKTFASDLRTQARLWVGTGSGNPAIIGTSNSEAGAIPMAEIFADNSAGGFAGIVIRGVIGSAAVGRSAGILFKMSSEANTNESNKAWELGIYSGVAWGNSPDFFIRNNNTARNALQFANATDDPTFSGFIMTLGRGGTTADAANLMLSGADAGAGGGGGGIYWLKNGASKWSLYTLGSGDGNLYVRDLVNAKMVMRFGPGGFQASQVEIYDKLTTDQLQVGRTIDISGWDLNSLTYGGFFNGSGMANAPDSGWWYIESMQHSNVASNYSSQRATELVPFNPRVYVRTRQAGTWGQWILQGGQPEPWIAPTLENSWVNYGAPFNTAGYRRVGTRVELKGLVKSGVIGSSTAIFTLPVGYRPASQWLLPAVVATHNPSATGAASTGTAHTHPITLTEVGGRIDVQTTGKIVTSLQEGNGWLSLDGLTFSLD